MITSSSLFQGDFNSTKEITVYLENLLNTNSYVAEKSASAILGTTGKYRKVSSGILESFSLETGEGRNQPLGRLKTRGSFKQIMENISLIQSKNHKLALIVYLIASNIAYEFIDLFQLNDTERVKVDAIRQGNKEINEWIEMHYSYLYQKILAEQDEFFKRARKKYGEEVYKVLSDFDYIFAQSMRQIRKRLTEILTESYLKENQLKEDVLKTELEPELLGLRTVLGSLYHQNEKTLCEECNISYEKYLSDYKPTSLRLLQESCGKELLSTFMED